MGCADQGERRIGRLTRFETAAQICLGESFAMIGVDARNDKLTCPIAKKAKGIRAGHYLGGITRLAARRQNRAVIKRVPPLFN
jgi:hypothetical protein